MTDRNVDRLVLGFTAVAVLLVSGCAEADQDAGAPSASNARSDPDGSFTANSPLAIVAGDDRGWLLTRAEDEAPLFRIDLEGRPTEVGRVPGIGTQMLPYRDGVVVASIECVDAACEEAIAGVTVVDGDGSKVSEQELDRGPGPLEEYDSGFRIFGVRDNLLWMHTNSEVSSFDPTTGRTASRAPAPRGTPCLVQDEVYALLPLDVQALENFIGGEVSGKTTEQLIDVAVHLLDDASWVPVAGAQRLIPLSQFFSTNCLGGGLRTGPADDRILIWSPEAGYVEEAFEPEPPSSVAIGHDRQRFVLESDGVIRRETVGSGAVEGPERLQVPARIFDQRSQGLPPRLLFDESATVVAGCVDAPIDGPDPSDRPTTAECYIGSK